MSAESNCIRLYLHHINLTVSTGSEPCSDIGGQSFHCIICVYRGAVY